MFTLFQAIGRHWAFREYNDLEFLRKTGARWTAYTMLKRWN